MAQNPPVVCLCGNMKDQLTFQKWAKEFTLGNCIVLTPVIFGDQELEEEDITIIDQIQRWKITMSDILFVIDTADTLDSLTSSYIGFAEGLGIQVMYASDAEEKEKEENDKEEKKEKMFA